MGSLEAELGAGFRRLMCHFLVVAAPLEFSPIDDYGRTWPRRRGPSAPSSGGVVLKVRVWSDAEREGGGALRHASERDV